jgi:hypothetical protein
LSFCNLLCSLSSLWVSFMRILITHEESHGSWLHFLRPHS